MEPVCRLRKPPWEICPFIWSNTLRTCLWMAPRPFQLKRAQLLDGRRAPRRPTEEDLRDRKVTRGRALCIGMSAGIMRNATMVEARSNSPRADRPHHHHGASAHISRSFQQAVVLMEKEVYMSNRDYVSSTGARRPRVLSGGMRIARLRIHKASMCVTLFDTSTGRAFGGHFGGRVERRAAGPTGQKSFVSIHSRPTVARDPSPEVYRGVREARQTHVSSEENTHGLSLIHI